MKIYRYIAMLVLAALAVSCKEAEVFYATSYSIVRIENTVTLTKPTPPTPPAPPAPEEPGEGEGEGEGEEGGTESGGAASAAEEPAPEDPIIAEILADMRPKFPMTEGGFYSIEFIRHNGGPLTMALAPDTQPAEGLFEKIPGKGTLTFYFSGYETTFSISSYDDNGTRRVVLAADLTAHYKALYPERKDIEKVVHREYTSTISK